MAAGVTQGQKPAVAMWRRWGWRLGSLHMHQQHAPGQAWASRGGQAGHHVMLLAAQEDGPQAGTEDAGEEDHAQLAGKTHLHRSRGRLQ